ncbi:glycosyl transferase [Marivirga tractuosa]|uniref:Glycosyltransferase-distantly-related protein n=1 Tax=Marivirga tractuosa (strain ATCC 23168 / DSM 4126 / NBRC 15989 / NCIMB 1408 / VKM B-1430 / H-43) TaxID=643867 RepID=E4TMX8_MARTH|nr:glycosyltransferase family protein [Marivirga tractuosa]ADR21409.1 glycosyltransferase-distantly-related protein [Marivirga tractuosa DSM 4126]BDD14137.1 glycosyl transferase [Marivirga tractuosa]
MKILYAIQGTGNGHISRARDVIPILEQYGEVDVLISGTQADVNLDCKIKYQFHGLSFVFGKRGGVDFFKTLKQVKCLRFLSEIWNLKVAQYDLVINDFEPVSAWVCMLKAKKCIGLSHQSAVVHPFSPKPIKTDWLGYLVLKYYAPVNNSYGFHFRTYADRIYNPVIRQEIRNLETREDDFYTVYLPAYSDERIIKILSKFKVHFKVFSKHSKVKSQCDNIEIIPIDNRLYLKSLAKCKGVICGAGFEGPAEALFLQKKLLVIPMKGQYEQQCNAAALEKMGVKVIESLKASSKKGLDDFFNSNEKVNVNYPNQTDEIIRKLVFENVASGYVVTTDSFSFSR